MNFGGGNLIYSSISHKSPEVTSENPILSFFFLILYHHSLLCYNIDLYLAPLYRIAGSTMGLPWLPQATSGGVAVAQFKVT